MYADGYLHVFTSLFGWHYYGYLWHILVGSGLVFLPIIGILIDHASQVRGRASLMNTDSESAFSGLEVQLFTVMLVLIIAAVPNAFITVNAGAVKHQSETTTYADSMVVTPGTTDSTYDDAVKSDEIDVASSSVKVPPWWYLVINVSQGIKQAMLNAYDTRGDSFRAIKRLSAQASIKNPELRDHVDQFNTYCYGPAMAAFEKDRSSAHFITPDTGTRTTVGPDTGWIGSQYLVDNYYGSIRVDQLVSGFAFDGAVSTEYETAQTGGQPLCTEYWTKIQESIYTQATDEGMIGVLERIKTWYPDWMPWGVSDNEARQQIAMTYLSNTPVNILPGGDQIVALRDGDMGMLERLGKTAEQGLAAWNLGKIALMAEAGLDALIYALEIGQAYILMVIYMMLPIGLLVSRYSISFLMQAGLLIFVVTFWSALWGLVAWLDNVVAASMFNENIMMTLVNHGLAESNKRLAHAIAIATLYIAAPVFAAWVLVAAGSRMGHTLGPGMTYAAMGMSVGAAGSWAPAAVIGAVKKAGTGTKKVARATSRSVKRIGG